jgi:undecaprenyl-diphosphatase
MEPNRMTTSVLGRDEGVERRPTVRPDLHRSPPMTPSSFYASRRRLLVGIGLLFAFVAVAAAVHHAWLLERWDLPIQRFVEGHRNPALDTAFRLLSRSGSTAVVVSGAAVLAALSWKRCRAVTVTIVVAAAARPLLEYGCKTVIGRSRPDLEPLVHGRGPSFPSGHVFAAIALYGLVPLVIGLYTRRRALWWASAAVSAALIGGIAASRVYLGAHWSSDVVGSLLLGSFFLLGVEVVSTRAHRVPGLRCRGAQLGPSESGRVTFDPGPRASASRDWNHDAGTRTPMDPDRRDGA